MSTGQKRPLSPSLAAVIPLGSPPKTAASTRQRVDLGPGGAPEQFGAVQYTDEFGEWRSVPGFDSELLIVSSLGYARSRHFKSGSMCRPHKGTQKKLTGYCSIRIYGIDYRLHCLICRAFQGPQPAGATCDHIAKHDTRVEERSDNRAENLRWASNEEQMNNRRMTDVAKRGSRPIFVRHISWDALTPSMWFSSGYAADKALGIHGIGVVVDPNYPTKVTCMGYTATRAPAMETQEDLPATESQPAERWVQFNERVWVSNRGRCHRMSKRGTTFDDRFTPVAKEGQDYAIMKIGDRNMPFHVIVFKAFGGVLSFGESVDHIDRDRTNNSLQNLRAATASEQSRNRTLKPPSERRWHT